MRRRMLLNFVGALAACGRAPRSLSLHRYSVRLRSARCTAGSISCRAEPAAIAGDLAAPKMVGFVKTGDPGWPGYDVQHRHVTLIDREPGVRLTLSMRNLLSGQLALGHGAQFSERPKIARFCFVGF